MNIFLSFEYETIWLETCLQENPNRVPGIFIGKKFRSQIHALADSLSVYSVCDRDGQALRVEFLQKNPMGHGMQVPAFDGSKK